MLKNRIEWLEEEEQELKYKMLYNIYIATGFSSPRLGIDSLIARDNAEDLKDVLRFCREHNILPYFESFVITTVRPQDYEGRVLSQQGFDELFREL